MSKPVQSLPEMVGNWHVDAFDKYMTALYCISPDTRERLVLCVVAVKRNSTEVAGDVVLVCDSV